jgi:predicted anti-sigma-YlaC factor YlaD
MDHQEIIELLSAYADGELQGEQKQTVDDHLKTCSDCRRELNELKRFEEVMAKMELKKADNEVWKRYWDLVYNRLERRIGWILLSLGGMILLFFGGYKLIEGLIQDSGIPLLLKVGLLIFMAGIVVMLISFVKEQLFVYKRERYREVEK